MRYRRTRIILPQKGHPLDTKDMIKRWVNKEDVGYIESTPKPPSTELIDPLKPSPGLLSFYKGIIRFSTQFIP